MDMRSDAVCLRADYSRMFMKMACEYLEGSGKFSTDGASSGPVVDPRVRVTAQTVHEQTADYRSTGKEPQISPL